jgi:signal peptidase I
MKNFMKLILNCLLITILLISGATFLTSKPTPLGIRTFAVKSGSMEPAIATGSLIVTQTNTPVRQGDIITFQKDNEVITHRIDKVTSTNSYITKGDANKTHDQGEIAQSNILGKQILSIPFLGYYLLFLRTLPGLIISIIIPAVIFILLEIISIAKEIRREFDRRVEKRLAAL